MNNGNIPIAQPQQPQTHTEALSNFRQVIHNRPTTNEGSVSQLTNNNIPIAQPQQPQTRLMRNRSTTNEGSVSQLTNTPIIIYGIRVPDNDPKLAAVMRTVANLALLIAVLQVVYFVASIFHTQYLNEHGNDLNLVDEAAIMSLVIFGCCVPMFGWWGAKQQNINGLSCFCMGEGLVAAFGGCEFALTVLTVTTYLNGCSSPTCERDFKNTSVAICMYGGDENVEPMIIQRTICEQILNHWSFWTMLALSGGLVCAGIAATQFSMQLRNQVISRIHKDFHMNGNNGPRQNQTHVVPVGGVVGTTSVIREGTQHYTQPGLVTGVVVSGGTTTSIPRAAVVGR